MPCGATIFLSLYVSFPTGALALILAQGALKVVISGWIHTFYAKNFVLEKHLVLKFHGSFTELS
jgi:hypothetical protein